MKFLDLFAGIGGFRLALEKAGHTCIGFCEIDKFARQTYKVNFDTEGEWEGHDITKVTDEEIKSIGAVDIICGGFPCQAFSIAGNRLGFADTRGTLFFELCRFIELLQPKIVFCENVKGLLSHDKGRTFFIILNTLGKLGYDIEYQVLNSKSWVPQNRERVYIVGRLRGRSSRKVFPLRRTSCQALKQIIGGRQGQRVYSTEGTACTIQAEGGGWGAKTGLYMLKKERSDFGKKIRKAYENGEIKLKRDDITKYAIREDGLSNTLSTVQKDNLLIDLSMSAPKITDVARCLTASYYKGATNRPERSGVLHLEDNDSIPRIRRLTPLECFRLQGFPDEHCKRAKEVGISDTQLYKQAGNSITVPVIYEIAKRLQ